MKKWIFFLVGISLICQDIFAQGCSQCRMLSTQGSELSENSFGSNINSGILYLMIIPYIILLILFIVFRKRIIAFFKALAKQH